VTGIEPEIVTAVEMSNTDVNRVVCPYPVTDYAASKEKNILLKMSGNNLFVKFPVTAVSKDGQVVETKYFKDDAELFLVCGDAVYSLVMKPKTMKAETIYLSDTKGRMKKTNEFVRSMSEDDLLVKIMESMVTNEPLPDFQIGSSDETENYRGIEVSTVKVMTGGGYTAKELVLKSDKKISLTDTELLKLKILGNVKALGILSPTFTGMTKAYVVEGRK
jgi:conjugal transfer pilus assembly protein TraK